MKHARTVALIAGFGFFFFAIILQGVIPAVLPESESVVVERTLTLNSGARIDKRAVAQRRSKLEQEGYRIYIREGCWYCHSQYIRPVARETDRWGPLSEAGEYAYDQPHMFGTRRIGPDLIREGGKYGNDWHIAHFFSPRMIVPDSIMPRYPWVLDRGALRSGKTGDALLSNEGKAIVAYMQSLGRSKGQWRDSYLAREPLAGGDVPTDRGAINRGKDVYVRRCAGCHGVKGDGEGEAGRLFQVKPRDFTSGVFKFKSTRGNAIPTDSDFYRTLTYGLRGTSMPSFANLPPEQRRDVIAYIKEFIPEKMRKNQKVSILSDDELITGDPGPSLEAVRRGKRVYELGFCFGCHGKTGRGDGPAAETLTDYWGNRVLATDFTAGVYKSGPRNIDLVRTISLGVHGTPMPLWETGITLEDRWAAVYYLRSLDADDTKKIASELTVAEKANNLWCRIVIAVTGKDPRTGEAKRFK